MKITEKHIRKVHDQLQKIVDNIEELALRCDVEKEEHLTDMAESLWTAQSQIEDARQLLDGC